MVPQTGVVQRIVVQGNERIEHETILSYLPMQVGDTVGPGPDRPGDEDAVRGPTCSPTCASSCRAATCVVQVVENPIINQVLFEGNSNIKDDKLKDEVTVRPRGIFTKAKVQERRPAHRRALSPRGPHLGDRDAEDRQRCRSTAST